MINEQLQWGNASTCDFGEQTLTFDMPDKFYIRAGKYAIIRVETLEQEMAIEKLVESFNP